MANLRLLAILLAMVFGPTPCMSQNLTCTSKKILACMFAHMNSDNCNFSKYMACVTPFKTSCGVSEMTAINKEIALQKKMEKDCPGRQDGAKCYETSVNDCMGQLPEWNHDGYMMKESCKKLDSYAKEAIKCLKDVETLCATTPTPRDIQVKRFDISGQITVCRKYGFIAKDKSFE